MGVIKSIQSIVRKNSTGSDFQRRRVNLIEGANVTLTVADDSANNEVDVTIAATGAAGAPSDATYITQTADGTLSAEQALASLATGIMKVTTTTGVVSSVAAPSGAVVGDTDTQTLTNKTIGTTNLISFNSPDAYLINGKIVPSVATNDLTVAIKGIDGNDPSATNPVYIRIGDTIRSITAALSVTKNDATNWFNAGSAELATKEIDYFVYIGYNATDGVVLGFSRIPYARLYSDFSATTTNERYAAISTITNAAAGDNYVNIGRFAATLSAGAGYTWTVPTFTSKNLIQQPIYETRWLTFASTVASGSGTPTTVTHNKEAYKIVGDTIDVNIDITVTNKGTAASLVTCTTPIAFTGTGQITGAGAEIAATGKLYRVQLSINNPSRLDLADYLNGTLWVDTYQLPFRMSYQV